VHADADGGDVRRVGIVCWGVLRDAIERGAIDGVQTELSGRATSDERREVSTELARNENRGRGTLARLIKPMQKQSVY
jgi:hypothetical protein